MSIRADALGIFRMPDGQYIDVKPDHFVHSIGGPVGITITAPDAFTHADQNWTWLYFPDELKWKATGDVVMQSVRCIDH